MTENRIAPSGAASMTEPPKNPIIPAKTIRMTDTAVLTSLIHIPPYCRFFINIIPYIFNQSNNLTCISQFRISNLYCFQNNNQILYINQAVAVQTAVHKVIPTGRIFVTPIILLAICNIKKVNNAVAVLIIMTFKRLVLCAAVSPRPPFSSQIYCSINSKNRTNNQCKNRRKKVCRPQPVFVEYGLLRIPRRQRL